MLNDYINIIILLCMIVLGYFLTKINLFTKDTQKTLSLFILEVALPMEILLRVIRDFSKKELISLFKDIILPVCSISLLFVISLIIIKIFKIQKKNSGMFSLLFSTSSAAFLGIPIALTLFGDKGVPYALIYYISNSALFWTIGVFLVNKDAEYAKGNKEKLSILQILKSILNPIIISFFVGLILVLLKINVPKGIQEFLGYIGGTTIPLAMIYIGIVIYTTGFRNLKINKENILILIGRYGIAPAIIFGLSWLFGISKIMTEVSFILAALPCASGTVILAGEKDVNVNLATSSVLTTTIFYLIYFPFVIYIISHM